MALFILLSGAFLILQVVVTDYGADDGGGAATWFVIGACLLWLVYRGRSRVAGIVIAPPSLRSAALVVA